MEHRIILHLALFRSHKSLHTALGFGARMLRTQPTRLTLKQEDLKEYEVAKAAWVDAKAASATGGHATALRDKDGVMSADSIASHKRRVQSRIGLTK